MSSVGRFCAVFAAVACLSAVVGPAAAQTQSAPTTTSVPPKPTSTNASSIEAQLHEAYDDASAAEAATLDVYKASLQKTDEFDAQLVAFDAAIATVDGYLVAAKAKLAAAKDDLTVGQARLADVQRQLAAERVTLNRKAVSAYITGDRQQLEAELVLSASEIRSVESTYVYAAAIVDDQLAAVARVRALDAEVTQVRDRLAATEATARTTTEAIDGFDKELTTKRAGAATLREAQLAETARQQQLLTAIRAKKKAYLDRLHALERESDGISALLRVAQAKQVAVIELPVVRTPLEKPVALESPFGMRLHPIFQELRLHTGADLSGVIGQPVRASAAGKVVFADEQDGYGKVVVIDHGNQIATVYAHLSSFSVNVGTVVARGDLIAKVGATGYATGPHLHFEYRVSGAPIDPMPHIDFDEPLPGSCEALTRSKDPADQALVKSRVDCAAAATTTTSARATTTTATR